MKGKNTLILNAATMIEALQEYFDKRAAAPVYKFKVTGVGTEGSYGFKVEVEERPTEQEVLAEVEKVGMR